MPATRRFFLTGAGSPKPARAMIGSACLTRQGVHCQSCADACPEQAIGFTPRIGGPPLPRVEANRCTGCGDCVAACPASAITVMEAAGA
jgi:ferredoxin-type protein NapF